MWKFLEFYVVPMFFELSKSFKQAKNYSQSYKITMQVAKITHIYEQLLYIIEPTVIWEYVMAYAL